MKILLIEDDESFSKVITKVLSEKNYVVDRAINGEQGWDYAQSFPYNLILLDVSLPRIDGITLCRRLRAKNYHTPILLLTSKNTNEDKIMGLDAGADDYVVKPCNVSELLARIRALLRRPNTTQGAILEWGELQLDPSACQVTWQKKMLLLSPKEYGLLELFLRHPQQVLTKNAILDHLWSFDEAPGEETVRAHIKGLRRKFKEIIGVENVIETVYGIGYRLKAPPTNLLEAQTQKTEKDTKITTEIANLWQRFKEPTLERLLLIEKAVTTLESQTIPEPLRYQAEQEAHKLAGSLGMYGFVNSSVWARDIETILKLLKDSTGANLDQASELKILLKQLRQELTTSPATNTLIEETEVSSELPLLLAVVDDANLREVLEQEATMGHLQVKMMMELETSPQKSPHWLLLELSESADLSCFQNFLQQYPQVPLIVCGNGDRLEDRLTATRLGCRTFLPKPITRENLESTLAELNPYRPLTSTKVLAVDDDPLLLDRLGLMLTSCQIQLYSLTHPRRFWEVLQTFAPDLLLLDLEMPEINGLDLCRMIRSDRTWQHLPVLFLSANRTPEAIRRIYQAGADDYIPKPVTPSELVTCITRRLMGLGVKS